MGIGKPGKKHPPPLHTPRPCHPADLDARHGQHKCRRVNVF
ncbi:hypothetical protein [Prevotella nigrescens]